MVGKVVVAIVVTVLVMVFLFGVCGGRITKRRDVIVPARDQTIVPVPVPNAHKEV